MLNYTIGYISQSYNCMGYAGVDLAKLLLNFLTCFSTTILGRSNENCDWHVFTI